MYAPGTVEAETHMISILQSLNLSHSCSHTNTEQWHLLPMISSVQKKSTDTQQSLQQSDLTSSSLGDKLIDALERTRALLAKNTDAYQQNESVLFLGMDSPEIPIEEVVYGLQISSSRSATNTQQNVKHSDEQERRGKAHLCPANDGGYGLLSVPVHAPSSIFSGVRWSNHLTAISQLKALTDAGVNISIGKLMYDIDEPEDVHGLASRLSRKQQSLGIRRNSNDDVLTKSSGSGLSESSSNSACAFTLQTLIDLGVAK